MSLLYKYIFFTIGISLRKMKNKISKKQYVEIFSYILRIYKNYAKTKYLKNRKYYHLYISKIVSLLKFFIN